MYGRLAAAAPSVQGNLEQLWEGYTSELSVLLGAELEAVAKDPCVATFHRAVGNVIDHMVAHHRDNPAFLGIWRSVDGSPELRALNRQDTLRVADAIGAAVLKVRPDADPNAVLTRALIACETASATVKLAQELPTERLTGLYETLKSVLIEMLAEVQ